MDVSPLMSNLLGSASLSTYYSNQLNKASSSTSASSVTPVQKAKKVSRKDSQLSSMLSVLEHQLGKKTDFTPESANKAAASGVPTHGFFYHDIDALAKEAASGTDALDSSFAKDTLDFFTGGNYSQSDVDVLNDELSAALQELGTQVQETGSVNANALNSRVSVGGVELSLKDLADFQTMGQKLSPAFQGISATSSRFDDMQSTAKMAVARLAGRKFGETRGQAGQMFSSAMDALYDKGMDRVNQFYSDPSSGLSDRYIQDAQDVRGQVSQLFSQIRTDNKSLMAYDFNRSLNSYTGMLNQQYRNFGTPAGYRNANAAAQQMGMYFSALSMAL